MNRIHGGRLFEEEEKRGSLFLDFSSSINPWGPPPVLRENWFNMWQWVSAYPPLDISLFQRWIARIYGFPERAILPCNGATQGIYLLGRLLEGKKVTIIEPCFTEYTFAFRVGGKEVEHFFYLGNEEAERSLKSLFDTCPDIIVMGNPPNPLGNPYPEGFLKAVWEYALEKELFLVIDEVFQEFMDEETSFSKKIEEYQRLFI
ncbi:MAG: aminotransferase class I/II-fold pyridoxal phosphate-dependent enzyme, partial [Candidatus Atribacteria bacterium]|nr:aminotransferase class I/II-fold pyridoxal phosphate-dependent enzyme [Candidatus Atribacteria bacterium]MCD6350130.1 aminotransferase class I/II-fold pyridoxal phosphate-dependent enzyme [Candidatus Atribacteria bacterium]